MTSAETKAAVHETHIGVVILLGDRAYKIKKPVRTGFLDFSTHSAAARRCTGSSSSTAGSPPTCRGARR